LRRLTSRLASRRQRAPSAAELNLGLFIRSGDGRAHPEADNEFGASQETSAKQFNEPKNGNPVH
jgi:hypothetical protein